MSSTQFWLYIEPYVYISCIDGKSLFYNTIDGSRCESDKPEIFELSKKLNDVNELYVISINSKELHSEPIHSFFLQLKKHYMADVIDIAFSEIKPVQIIPRYKIVHDFDKYGKEQLLSPVNHLAYINGINLYINYFNGSCRINNPQFIYPVVGTENHNLSIEIIEKIFEQLKNSGLEKVNIIVGNHKSNDFLESAKYLNSIDIIKRYYFLLDDVDNNTIDVLESIDDDRSIKYLIIDSISISKGIKITNAILKFNLIFIISSESEYEQVEQFINKNSITQYVLIPYYNLENLTFFKENVFIDEDALFYEVHSMKDIFTNQSVNLNYFGKLSILPNGDVNSRLNGDKLGNVNECSINDLIGVELFKGNTWRLTRNKVVPCNRCIYNSLCPPISDYELSLGQFNLCNLRENECPAANKGCS